MSGPSKIAGPLLSWTVNVGRMAHFLLTPVGSSGDVHPFVGIGRALRARGHDVTLITSEPFRRISERAGLRFVGTASEEDYDRRGVVRSWSATSLVLRLGCSRRFTAHRPRPFTSRPQSSVQTINSPRTFPALIRPAYRCG